jgi:cytoskeletal protein RodZ
MALVEGTVDFGGTLKRLREARGIALRDIAESTKVSVSALEALERNDISRLPGGIFRRGIIRAYAGAIGAEPEQLVRDFDAQFTREGTPPRFARSSSVAAGPGQTAKHVAIAVAVLLAIAALLASAFLVLI